MATGVSALLAVLTLAFPIMASAQDESRLLVDLRIVRVEAGAEEEFIDLQENIADTLQSTNRGPRDVWMEIGETPGVFHIIRPVNEHAETEQGSALSVVTSSKQMTLRLYPELTIPPVTGEASGFLSLTYTSVKRVNRGAYLAWIRDHLRPIIKAAGTGGVVFTRVEADDATDTWITASNADGPNGTGVPDHEGSELIETSKTIMLRHIPSASVGVD